MSIIIDQRRENFFDFTRRPEFLSMKLSLHWNEEIPDTKLFSQAVRILRDVHCPSSVHKITKALFGRIEQKLSSIRKMLKLSCKYGSSADPIDKEIYRFARLIQQCMDCHYYWTVSSACTALMLFLQDMKYTLRFADEDVRQQCMEAYSKDYVSLWRDYLGDHILLEWQAAKVINTINDIADDKAFLERLKDTEAQKILDVPGLRERYRSIQNKTLDNIEDAEEAHGWLYLSYTENLSSHIDFREQFCEDLMMTVEKTEPILQQREQELIAMSRQYRQEWKNDHKDECPSREDIEKECDNTSMKELLASILSEERINRIFSTEPEDKQTATAAGMTEEQQDDSGFCLYTPEELEKMRREREAKKAEPPTREDIAEEAANMPVGELLESTLGEEGMKRLEDLP